MMPFEWIERSRLTFGRAKSKIHHSFGGRKALILELWNHSGFISEIPEVGRDSSILHVKAAVEV